MLIEALVAILLFSVGVVAVMGMQTVSIEQVSQAKYRTDASYLANQIIGMMWLDSSVNNTNLPSWTTVGYSKRVPWDAVVASTLPNGTGTIATVAGSSSMMTITINWRMPNETTTRKFVTIANINATN
jgi:type IV pilus assembly protein PilV